jgi:tetratricopeptide (TPR) repeat protein
MGKIKSKKSAAAPRAKKPVPTRTAGSKSQPDKGKSIAARNRKSTPGAVAPAPAPVARKLTPQEVAHKHAMERFESALALFGQSHFAKARSIFERLKDDPAKDLAERAGVYVRICDQRLQSASLQLKTAEDYYNYAVGLANQGNAEESEEFLQKALKLSPKSDYIYYALATTHALRDNLDGALENLGKAIELNERNRYQAQNDADFANLLEDPRFTELLYPEKPIS